MERDQIIMSFSTPPSGEDIQVIARNMLETLPDELLAHCEDLTIEVEDFPDEAIQQELELEDPYELLALYRSGSEISPGVTKKTAEGDDMLLIFRRPLLDAWCETFEDINILIRQVMIEELGQTFEFSEEDIEEMAMRDFAGVD